MLNIFESPEYWKEILDKKGGVKHDQGKPRADLIAPEALFGLAEVLAYGAEKKGYGERNWEQGMSWGRVFGATIRHLFKWWGGEDYDPESGLPHLWHALANVHFLVAYEQRRIGTDTRTRVYGASPSKTPMGSST